MKAPKSWVNPALPAPQPVLETEHDLLTFKQFAPFANLWCVRVVRYGPHPTLPPTFYLCEDEHEVLFNVWAFAPYGAFAFLAQSAARMCAGVIDQAGIEGDLQVRAFAVPMMREVAGHFGALN